MRRRWLVSIDFDLDLDPAQAVELGLPVDRGPRGPELLTSSWSHVTRARSGLEAEAVAEKALRQLCSDSGWPAPKVRRALVLEAGWFGRRPRQAPRRVPPRDGPPDAGVREPRRPGPSTPPPAAQTPD